MGLRQKVGCILLEYTADFAKICKDTVILMGALFVAPETKGLLS